MPREHQSRSGSLQFYPRKRADKLLPRCNWNYIKTDKVGMLGFIGYKVGMSSAFLRDNTPNSLTKGQRITIPVTLVECPKMKILSVRLYKNGIVLKEFLNDQLDKELKRKIKLPKKQEKIKLDIFEKEDFDDLRLVVYSQVKKTGIKKTPDIIEIGLSGNKNEKINFIKDNLNKEISIKDIFKEEPIDIKAVTKGKGFQGPTKRFGTSLRSHKSEKGQRGPGSIGPWHPARIDFTIPFAGQMGLFTRLNYNSKIILLGNIIEKDVNPKEGFNNFGKIKTEYIILNGSVQGPSKRVLLLTKASKPSKKQVKKNYEFIELR
jgi:large subunit ribosomal protein L3